MSRDELLQALRENRSKSGAPPAEIGMREWTVWFHAERRNPVKNYSGLSSYHGIDLRSLQMCIAGKIDMLYKKKKKKTFVLSNPGAELETDEFMNSKKSHEVQSMSEVVACLTQRCGVKQVE